jgi:hypothetical protein
MPTTDVRIINQALSHIGHTQFIDSRSEDSQEVAVSDVHYDDALAYVLEDFNWGFARRTNTLGLVEDFTDVTTPHDWAYSYRYPSETVKIRRVMTTLGRLDPNPPPFEIGSDDTGRLVLTDQEDCVVETTKLITDAQLYTAMFASALSWYLAFLMVPGLAKDKSIAGDMLRMYHSVMRIAEANDANEAQFHPQLESEAIRARE